jgi:2-keto-4-pentenoate hydratase
VGARKRRDQDAIACTLTSGRTPDREYYARTRSGGIRTVEDAALIDSFWDARRRGEYFPAAWFDKLTIDQAYRIQLGMVHRRCEAGEQQIGWKVGLTAKAMQEQFGIHEPVFGCVLHCSDNGRCFAPRDLISPGFENELCMRLGRDLSGVITVQEASAAVDVVYPSLEIIETRGPFTAQIALALADNAQQKTVVLGAPAALPGDLENIEAKVYVNDQLVGSGTGDAVLGNPLNSIVWLAGKLGQYGRKLAAGEIIMTGSFTRQFPLSPGDRVRTDFSGLGSVETSISSA